MHLSPSSLVAVLGGWFGTVATLDTTIWRDYRIDGTFGIGYEISVDSAPTYTGSFAHAGAYNRLTLGDAGGLGSGVAEVSAYSLRQPVPEPATWALMLAGIAGLAGWARRRCGG